MCARASFQPNQAARKDAKELLHVIAPELPSENCSPMLVSPVNLKDRFGNVETNHVNFIWHGNILPFDHAPYSPPQGGSGRGRPCHHVRRRFYELAQSGPAPIATEALARTAELYKIESEIRGRSPEERRIARQERSRPIIDAFEPWLRGNLALVSQKSKLAEAIRYPLSRWAGLGRFLNDGRVEIDSNVVERSIRPIALNRKNALFAGSDGGAIYCSSVDRLIN